MSDQSFYHLHIPDFKFPWASACSPYRDLVEEEMLEWAVKYNLIPNGRYLERVKRTKYGWLAARCYPFADYELLRTIADYFVWYFLSDDLFIDRVEITNENTIGNLTAIIDVLDLNKLGEDPVYGEAAWLDICQRLRKQLTNEGFERFANGMRLWASTAGLQILNQLSVQSVGITTYETIRRHSSGINPCIDLIDAANSAVLSAAEFYLPEVQTLRRHVNNVVCWSNDIQSLLVEMKQPGQNRNIVVIYSELGSSLQDSINHTARRVVEEIYNFQELSQEISFNCSVALSRFITGMKNWMHGYQDWVMQDTLRYSNIFASDDADDRGVFVGSTII